MGRRPQWYVGKDLAMDVAYAWQTEDKHKKT